MTKYLVTDDDRAYARKITSDIKKAADNLWELLLEAWNVKAYASLGYKSWNAYVDGEFDFTRRQSYYLLSQARVTKQIREAASTDDVQHVSHQDITVPIRDAVAIEPVIGEVAEEVREQVAAGVPAQEAVRSAVESHRPPPVTRVQVSRVESGQGSDWFYEEPETCAHEYVCRHCGELQ